MEIFRIAICTVLFSAAILYTETPTMLTPRQAAIKAKTAHSEADYRALADFYKQQALSFSNAAKQQHEAYQYSLHHASAKSYPQPADRARQLSEYYEERSKQSSQLATLYANKAQGVAMKPAATEAVTAVDGQSTK